MIGLSTSGSISFGCALVAGRNRVPRPAAGKTALRTVVVTSGSYQSLLREATLVARTRAARERRRAEGPRKRSSPGVGGAPREYDSRMLDPVYVRDHIEAVRTGLRNRGMDADNALEDIATLETARRRLIPELEGLKRQQN